MTKDEAIAAMQAGKKVTHRYFSDNEWIKMYDGKILTEEGYRLDPSEFWLYRLEPAFTIDWEISQETDQQSKNGN